MIDEIASHFYEINEETINELEESILEAILSSKKIQVKSEDSLLHTLLNRRSYIQSKETEYENEHEFFIEKVQFEYLSTESIEIFLNEFEFKYVNENIWKSVTKRLVLPVEVETKKKNIEKFTSLSINFTFHLTF